MPNDVEREAEQQAKDRLPRLSPLEQTLQVGVNGPPELRRGERSQFLGQFPEQVLKAASRQAIKGKQVPAELVNALADPRCERVYLAAASIAELGPILRIIRQRGLRFTVVQAPEHASDTAIVLTTNQPQDGTNIWVRG